MTENRMTFFLLGVVVLAWLDHFSPPAWQNTKGGKGSRGVLEAEMHEYDRERVCVRMP